MHNLRLLPGKTDITEGSKAMETTEVNITRSRRFPRNLDKRPGKLVLVASLVLSFLLLGSAVVTWSFVNNPNLSHFTFWPTPTPLPTYEGTCPNFTLPDSQTPYPGFQTLCAHKELVAINQTKTLENGKLLTIVAGYADNNSLFLWYHMSWDSTHFPRNGTGEMLQTSPHIGDPSASGSEAITGGSGSFAGKYDQLDVSDLENVPANQEPLDVRVVASLTHLAALQQSQEIAGVTFNFSLPLHLSRIITPDITVTANGVKFTLHKVTLSPTSTTLELISLPVNFAKEMTPSSGFTLVINKQSVNFGNDSQYFINEPTGGPFTFKLIVPQDLSNQTGSWTLTMSANAIPGSHNPWVFTFRV
jgi:hypothetical protein